jgi:hypothetical protein
MLVEMFPTRIRYTSLSVPYHVGVGWFGGFLPATAFAIIAANGNIYSGLWYPVITASIALVISLVFVKETKDVDISAVEWVQSGLDAWAHGPRVLLAQLAPRVRVRIGLNSCDCVLIRDSCVEQGRSALATSDRWWPFLAARSGIIGGIARAAIDDAIYRLAFIRESARGLTNLRTWETSP